MDIFAALLTVLPYLPYMYQYKEKFSPAVAPRLYYTDGPFAEALVDDSPLPQYMAPNTCMGETLEQTTHQCKVAFDALT
jgi:hypothetical protein